MKHIHIHDTQTASSLSESESSFLKDVVLLALGLFLAVAPSPGAEQIIEFTRGFISSGIF